MSQGFLFLITWETHTPTLFLVFLCNFYHVFRSSLFCSDSLPFLFLVSNSCPNLSLLHPLYCLPSWMSYTFLVFLFILTTFSLIFYPLSCFIPRVFEEKEKKTRRRQEGEDKKEKEDAIGKHIAIQETGNECWGGTNTLLFLFSFFHSIYSFFLSSSCYLCSWAFRVVIGMQFQALWYRKRRRDMLSSLVQKQEIVLLSEESSDPWLQKT